MSGTAAAVGVAAADSAAGTANCGATNGGADAGRSGGAAGPASSPPCAWSDAVCAAALFALDPAGAGPGGLHVRAAAGPVRDRFLALVTALLPPGTPVRRLPADVDAARLDGGLDLAATLATGRPVAAEGVLSAAAGGVLVLAMAERLSGAAAARIASAFDGEGSAGRRAGLLLDDGGSGEGAGAGFGVIALDEGIEADERVPTALAERLGLTVDLATVAVTTAVTPAGLAAAVAAARFGLATVRAGDETVTALCTVAAAFGIASLRAPLHALTVAKAAAALAGRDAVAEEDVTLAARLVLVPRALVFPAPPDQQPETAEPPPEPEEPPEDPATDEAEAAASPPPPPDDTDEAAADRALADVVVEAVRAALPPDLLAGLSLLATPPRRSRSEGRSGDVAKGGRRGRPVGVRRADPRSGDRISAYQTIRAAAPWQRLRRAEAMAAATGGGARDRAAAVADGDNTVGAAGNATVGTAGATGDAATVGAASVPRLIVRRDDFRAVRHEQRTGTTTIFVVDASGSSALNRLGEAKGAAELLLADCYVRRDRVALIAFRGPGAELLLPPTGSLTRAKRSLAGLPGGGGTPLSAGIDAAVVLADQVRRRGDTAVLVLLTDGGANIGRDGAAGRARAREDAEASARAVRAVGLAALLVDTAPRPDARARALADAMRATYLPLPNGHPETLARAVRGAAAAGR
jgi:magnesium chelatase subunit D